MALMELLWVASMPVIKVLLITAVGLVLALGNINLLGKDARIQVNNVTPGTLNQIFSSFFLSPFVYYIYVADNSVSSMMKACTLRALSCSGGWQFG